MTLGMVPGDTNTQQHGDGTQITKFEALAKLCLYSILVHLDLADDGEIINIDQNNDMSSAVLPNKYIVITAGMVESHLLQSAIQLLVPNPGCLLQTVQRPVEFEHHVPFSLLKAFGLMHVDIVHQISIKKRIRDVHSICFIVLQSTHSKNSPQSGPFGCRGKGLSVIKPRALTEALVTR
jgi:hypothetical protein